MASSAPVVLILEKDEPLRELNRLVLSEAGYQVLTPPDSSAALPFIEQTHPHVIVLGLRHQNPDDWKLLAELHAGPTTKGIPVVAIADLSALAALAKATPVTSATIVHPYNIDQLERAVANALSNPPPSAVLPPPSQPPSAAIDFAAEELAKNESQIVLQTVKELQTVEPYRSRYTELTPALVDNLAKMMETVVQGIRRSLSPTEVFAVPTIQRAIMEHVQLRRGQGFEAASAIREYQLLALHIRQFLFRLVDTHGFTHDDAFSFAGQVQRYVDALVREVIHDFTSDTMVRRR